MALVFEVIFSSIKLGLIVYVSIFGSTKTGTKSACRIAKILAIYVFAGTITSSPFCKFPS